MLRIISGIHRSRKLEQPPLSITRPTIDRVREAIFNSIRSQVPNALVLDLFAGSDAFALEAISNGAMKAVCVENHPQALSAIKTNVANLKINNLELVNTDVLSFLAKGGKEFDIIFLDPPYERYELLNSALQNIVDNKFLTTNGLVIVETNDQMQVQVPEGLLVRNTKKYGKVFVLYLAQNN
ncbi:16S rRNA (guanine(966)-N(2))-methyltransferase RsmD [Mycoplasmopsis columbinasalis]|uniref:DNA methylase n=1 Tax=Mycoplasmopsis columbinasalis TaxID=114880 RepID=A0A449BBA0_9BACT|nr:16S rRNA (guanine(966)-N(2))-methyltransferase RsmD [Mycoplasmopsis columbinasalis]VEU78319.1 DNA methylase [Mycoplasmopsis columbinasalis]